MDTKIIAGLFLWFCLMASISISQSASAKLDSRLRFRRQDDDTGDTTANGDSDDNDVIPGPQPGGRVELRVVVNPDTLQVQRGQTVELNCIVYGADSNTNVYWVQEEPERRYALVDQANDNGKQITASQVSLRQRITLDDPSKIGKYTCMAQDSAGNGGSAMLTMQEGGGYNPQPVYPTYPQPVYPTYPEIVPRPSGGGQGALRIVAPDMTEGDFIEIHCEGAASEDEGRIQWFFNNRLVVDEQPVYPRGKTLHIRPISRPYLGNYRCHIPGSNYIDANSVLTFGGSIPSPVTPSYGGPVKPVQPSGSHCSIDEVTCRNHRCVHRSLVCDGKNDCGDNSDETCGRTDACQPNEIHCSNPARGRKCVQKFWMCDGDRDCDDGSDEEQRYCELLPRQRNCKTSEFQCAGRSGASSSPVCIPRSFQCDGYNDCPDQSDEIGCVKPTIVSPPQRQIEIQAGQTLTIQCTARGSPAPYVNWRLNWGHVCGDGSDNGRCTMAQALDSGDPTLITGTLTVRNVNINDAGAYSCEALNNQGFTFAIPDAIVTVLIGGPVSEVVCSCNGHSTFCEPNGRCLNCQHNTAGAHCEYCVQGYNGDARRGTPYDCQPITEPPRQTTNCDPLGTHMERSGRCVCKYNVEGDRCDQCKRSHFYLNPTTPNGCLACFCSGVSSDCTSTDWRRHAVSLPLNNWSAVPRNFATDLYDARDRIQQRNGGRDIALDQNSLGRPANEVLYWKAPKEALGDVVTLYDGNIDIHFTNDGRDDLPPSTDEFIWLRGNNIDLVHKIPQTKRFKSNANSTYSVQCNERTFTRKDGTFIDRENILMALSDLDTFLVKINPIGGRQNAVLHGVTLHVAARDGYAETALTVESCRCPANYTGTSCEKCAEGYGRPHPLVGIYLGQCWSCRALCHERSDRCDRETGKCFGCDGNSEGDRCERCRAGYVHDAQTHQCVRGDGVYVPPPYPTAPPPYVPTRGSYYVNHRPYEGPGQGPFRIVLDGNKAEQRIPLQILSGQPQSVVWGRTDGGSLPTNVIQEDNDLVFRYPSAEQAGNYICTITHPDGSVERIPIYLEYHSAQPRPTSPGGPPRVIIEPKSITLIEGQRMIVQYTVKSNDPIDVTWNRVTDRGLEPMPSSFIVEKNQLILQRATPDISGTYQVLVRSRLGEDRQELYITVVPRRGRGRGQQAGGQQGPPQVSFRQGHYEVGYGEVIDITPTITGGSGTTATWSKDGSASLPDGVTARNDGALRIEGRSEQIAGNYQLNAANAYGQASSPIHIGWKGASHHQHGNGNDEDRPRSYVQVRLESRDDQSHHIGRDINLQCTVHGSVERPHEYTFTKDGRPLENNVEVHPNGVLIIRNAQANDAGRYRCEVAFPRAPEVGTQESSYDLRIEGGSAGGHDQHGSAGHHQGGESHHSGAIEVTVEPTEVNVGRGEKATITCHVKGTQQYKVTWGKYAHDTTLPSYAQQQGNSVIISPTDDTSAEQMYFQCQVDVPGEAQSHHAYATVNVRGGDETSKKMKRKNKRS